MPPDLLRSGRLQSTAQTVNSNLGWAVVSHPYHPLKGQRFPVLKTRRVSGKETLILGHPDFGSFGIIREWTDWGPPTDGDGCDGVGRRFDGDMLLDLVALVKLLANSLPKKSSKKELDK